MWFIQRPLGPAGASHTRASETEWNLQAPHAPL
jgi:hypothetical protein